MHKKIYKNIGLGGTFDHFHKGHEHFINFAANLSHKITIGVVSNKLSLKKPFSQSIQPFKKRVVQVAKFCQKNKIDAQIIELNDVFGPTLDDDSIQALVVTQDTTDGAEQINQTRKHLKMSSLPVHVCNLVQDSNGEKLSSINIRKGISLSSGIRLDTFLLNKDQNFIFSQSQKEMIRKIRVVQIKNFEDLYKPWAFPKFVVGDVCADLFLNLGIDFKIAVIDGKTQQKKIKNNHLAKASKIIFNPAGQITHELISELYRLIHQNHNDDLGPNKRKTPNLDQEKIMRLNDKKIIGVDGEEDLSALVIALIAPIGSIIYFGDQYKKMVAVEADIQMKEKIYDIIKNP